MFAKPPRVFRAATLLAVLGIAAMLCMRGSHAAAGAHMWPHGPAFSFRFDDGWPSQLQTGIPLLEELGVNATFFLVCDWVRHGQHSWKASESTPSSWRSVAAAGHELAGHTLMHTCGRANEQYTLNRMAQELAECDAFIGELRGAPVRTFGYPCGQQTLGPNLSTSYAPVVQARGYDFICNPCIVRGPSGWNNGASNRIISFRIDVDYAPPWETFETMLANAVRDGNWCARGMDSRPDLI